MLAERVLDRERVQAEAGLEQGEFGGFGVHEADPGELVRLDRAVLVLMQPQVPQTMPLRVDPGRCDGHLCSRPR